MSYCNRCGVPINNSNITTINIGNSIGLKYDSNAMFLTLSDLGFDIIQSNLILATLQKGDFFIGANSYNIGLINIDKFEYGKYDKFYFDKSVDFIIMLPQYDINSNQRAQWIKWRFFSSVFDEITPLDDYMTFNDLKEAIEVFGNNTEFEFECDLDRRVRFIDLNNIFQMFGKNEVIPYVYKESLNMEDFVTFRDYKNIIELINIKTPVDPCKNTDNNGHAEGFPFVPVPKACGECGDAESQAYTEIEYSQFLEWKEWNRMHKILVIDIPKNMFEGIMFQNIFYKKPFQIKILTLTKNI